MSSMRASIDLLRELLAEVRALRADLAAQRAAAPLADRVIEAIEHVVGGEAFDATRVIRLARERVPGRERLRAAIAEIVRDLYAPGAGRRLGRWLAQHVGSVTASGDFRLENSAQTRNGAGYRVARVAGVAHETRVIHRWP
jgi:hypothetical protein